MHGESLEDRVHKFLVLKYINNLGAEILSFPRRWRLGVETGGLSIFLVPTIPAS